MNLKKRVQKTLRRRQKDRYDSMIERQQESYDSWIRRTEAAERAGMSHPGAALTRQVVSMAELGAGFAFNALTAEVIILLGENSSCSEEEQLLLADAVSAEPERVLFYGDEDAVDGAGKRTNPWLKPIFSPDTLLSFFYFGNILAVNRAAAAKIPWLGSEDPKRNLYDFCLKASDDFAAIGHVDSVVCHTPGEIIPWGKEDTYQDLKDAACARRGWDPNPQGKVSILIPSKDNPRVLMTCIHTILEVSSYKNFEIIVIDNGSNEKNRGQINRAMEMMVPEVRFKYVYEPREFNFSWMCNRAASFAEGEYLLFLNDDIEIIQEDWLDRMVRYCSRPHVGAVGVKLLYPGSKTIQHCGITNIHLGPAHKLQFRSDENDHFYGRNKVTQDMLGVTGACMMMRKEIYEAFGGWNEALRVAFNDVDFCYRLHEMGYYNVAANDVTLYHHESLSRGLDDSVEKLKRLHSELDHLYEVHADLYNADPFYHRYLVTDVLDQDFHAANRYSWKDHTDTVVPQALENGLRPEWANEVLRMGIEFAGDMQKWTTGKPGGGDFFIQGWCYALQVDNSQYRFKLLLKPLDRGDGPAASEPGAVYEMPVNRQYRPDIAMNLMHMTNVEMTGISVRFDRKALAEGEYRIGFLWEDTCSRQKLYRWTAETICVSE